MNRPTLIYRFPAATFPVRFDFLGEQWALQVRPITNATFWVAQFVGRECWHLSHAGDAAWLLTEPSFHRRPQRERSFFEMSTLLRYLCSLLCDLRRNECTEGTDILKDSGTKRAENEVVFAPSARFCGNA
ncbi:hypothetical protein [Opitutus terrae]|uniref:Uncharacterized protein n=1 Tax=Opitutus terrae (strain DSM 11246 / JCM 15787 / PB90-1) TaxID=452637 RepID=B1ZYE9_OPITP|nr:hypothetical protein [Opitutus terrae]ACB77047.1 hypothetical protein Oter_3772 [Opitutus terrae PB90-1]